jgi:hypothetical protein
LLIRTHTDLTLHVRHNGETSTTAIQPVSGVIQGDPLSPFLFILVMDAVLRHLPYDAGALCDWRLLLRLPGLAYADDVVLLANTAPALRDLIAWFEAEALTLGLRLNTAPGKTEVLTVPRVPNAATFTCAAGPIRTGDLVPPALIPSRGLQPHPA